MFEYKVNEDISLKLEDHTDSKELFDLIDASRSHLSEWLSWVDKIQTEKDIIESIKRNLIDFSKQEGMHFVILYKGEIAGTVGLKYFQWDVKSAEIGYWLAPDYLGKGIMTEAVKGVMAYGFEYVSLDKIEIWAAEDNLKSRSIPERLNFVHEGMRRNNELIKGTYHTMMIYGMLKSEWITSNR
ncbi:MAG: GNAT family N-acetyltransferase [Alkalibacterium sp.]|nr:GNAT family N-acetyltransferase [Alkalibacterium sp.]